ncbi:Outer membrane lipoprotein [Sterolibacterium denitrificans]|uniref:Outer membrane lipoprotein n=1 Tax=Sterolibacterium denitrificans TaxID=157592 RepID=A0A7Z7MUC6_9PROT|nr:efflux transporter outer membrane subunit [Sterolibacterium denitrificans]SMB21109.1 Outer membrane lipoprotein [Sterolibacterium denitrificans]
MSGPCESIHQRLRLAVLGVCCALGLAGCATQLAVGPDYEAPDAAAVLSADRWQAALPHDGTSRALLDWWQSFNDPVLDELLRQAEADSPTLAEAVARIDEARSALTASGASHWPQLGIEGHAMRNNGSADFPLPSPTTTRGVTVDAQWEIDLFGRVRRSTEAARARLASSEHGWHAARISLAAEVAGKYVGYRACQLTLRTIAADLGSREETARIVDLAAKGGISAPADAQLAKAGAADTAGFHAAQQAACLLTRKSLVTLTGLPEERLAQLLDARDGTGTQAQAAPPGLPVPAAFRVDSLPVALLAQRPDLAAAERQLAAASADVGVATANRYPRLALVGNLTRDRANIAGTDVLSKPWFFGPSLTLPLFAGGALAAQQDAAQARHAQAYARYRQAVRGAIEEVEGTLVNLEAARQRSQHARIASQGFRGYFKAAEQNWRAGGISLLALEDARRLATAAERNEIALQRDHILGWIALYKALGGGWQAVPSAPATPPAADTADAPDTRADGNEPPAAQDAGVTP